MRQARRRLQGAPQGFQPGDLVGLEGPLPDRPLQGEEPGAARDVEVESAEPAAAFRPQQLLVIGGPGHLVAGQDVLVRHGARAQRRLDAAEADVAGVPAFPVIAGHQRFEIAGDRRDGDLVSLGDQDRAQGSRLPADAVQQVGPAIRFERRPLEIVVEGVEGHPRFPGPMRRDDDSGISEPLAGHQSWVANRAATTAILGEAAGLDSRNSSVPPPSGSHPHGQHGCRHPGGATGFAPRPGRRRCVPLPGTTAPRRPARPRGAAPRSRAPLPPWRRRRTSGTSPSSARRRSRRARAS